MVMTPPYWLNLEHGRYPIFVGQGLQDKRLWQPYLSQRVVILTDTLVAAHYLSSWRTFFESQLSCTVDVMTLTPGEQTKSLESATKVWNQWVEKGYGRDTTVVALGGGVIGDLAGFAAANYMRGIDFIQLPTSLMAQVDAAIGGKCAVNHPQGKNLIGTVYQPQAVFLDATFLETLPEQYYREGLAEVSKYGIALDKCFFEWLVAHQADILARDPEVVHRMLKWCCQSKVHVVSQDEHDNHIRQLLNFGHTLGHALEASTDYSGYRHGEAVALGMVFASFLSYRRGLMSQGSYTAIVSLLEGFGLPTQLPPHCDAAALAPFVARDKKARDGHTVWVLLAAIGEAFIARDVAVEDWQHALQLLQGAPLQEAVCL